MLLSLHVKNLALIDEAEIEFAKGLNILSGETGAGKSILLGSINLALGAKADKDCIRSGEEQAVIEMIFQLENDAQRRRLEELELTAEDDGIVIVQRRISEKRSVCKVCGETVTAKQLAQLAEVLLHIHGQRDNQLLLQEKEQRAYLDGYAGAEMQSLSEQVRKAYRTYCTCREEELQVREKEHAGEREIALAQFEVSEIERASLTEGEDEELERRYHKMLNGKKIMEHVQRVYGMTGDSDSQSASMLIGAAAMEMRSVAALDEEASGLEEQLVNIDALLSDFNRELSDYISDMEFDEREFQEVETRLDLINHLKSKYHVDSIGQIQAYLEKQQAYLEQMSDFDAYKKRVREKLMQSEKELRALCARVSALRKKTAEKLAKELSVALQDLNFLKAGVQIDVVPDEEHYTADGYDRVTFMLSLNPGEPYKPLSSVASGGELSRIMLALKTLKADKEGIDAMIFDEIDAGISGKTAWLVSEKLGALAKNSQVICITHLPQIAAMADTHFVIAKETKEGRTATRIHPVKEQALLEELARMLGGDQITEAALTNAAEMKRMAQEVKQ
ncbi:MAG: DNA repair protein RecN [Lachnospiraceae bacterium]|nr:DNA repair protein RecN [Lachnospiraceae bacterium]